MTKTCQSFPPLHDTTLHYIISPVLYCTWGGLEGSDPLVDASCSEAMSPPTEHPVPTTLLDSLASPPSYAYSIITRDKDKDAHKARRHIVRTRLFKPEGVQKYRELRMCIYRKLKNNHVAIKKNSCKNASQCHVHHGSRYAYAILMDRSVRLVTGPCVHPRLVLMS